MLRKVAIFHDETPFSDHCLWTSSISVASYTPAISRPGFATTSARVPRMGPDVITGEQMRIRFCADARERLMAWTSFKLRPGQKYGRTRVPSASADHGEEIWPEVATTGRSQSPAKFAA